LDVVNDGSHVTVFILDNGTIAMTGGQKSQATGKLENICEALGVEKEHIRIVNPVPKNHEENMKIFKEEIDYQGVSVIIPRRECIVTAAKRLREIKKIKEKEAVAG
jgi:indolepyruvate ferredoxin oxidoreductase alpha subunit